MESEVEGQVLFEVEDAIAWITLNRPEVKNAVTRPQRDRIVDLIESCAKRIDVRVIVLRGSGDSFCSGSDLAAGAGTSPAERPPDAPQRVVLDTANGIRTNAQRLITTIMDCEKPIIASVNGVAAGLGMHMAIACDLVLAADSARFIEVFIRRSLVPDGGGAYMVSRIIGSQRAKQLFFFGDDLSATAAFELGLVNLVVPADQLESRTEEWANRLASGPTRSIGLTKIMVNHALDMDFHSFLAMEATFQDLNGMTSDAREGISAFVERRKPEFKGW